MAADAVALADALGIDRFHLLGLSLGGAIAQEVALAAAERVQTLTLVVTFGRAGAWGRELSRLWGARVMETPRERHVDELLLLNFSEDFYEDPARVEYIRGTALANPHPQAPEAFARQLDASSRHDALERLPSLAMPVHVIGGAHDILVPVWKSEEVAAAIPGARLSIMEGAPHGLAIERAPEFNELALGFIAEHVHEN
jgi:pimeloyl-ACP methyl ester carboxylesterase